jgi:quinol monooxygenase YgiN
MQLSKVPVQMHVTMESLSANPEHLEKLKVRLRELSRMTHERKAEERCVFYDFVEKGNVFVCLEAYTDAEHLLLHVRNVTPFLGEHILPHAPIARVQVFGPKDQLDILKSDDKFLAFRPEFYPSIGEGFFLN